MLRTIVEQHAEDAAFSWTMRRVLVKAPRARLDDLRRLDRRVEANLDGLAVAGDGGVEIALGALGFGEVGEVFAAAALACRVDPLGALGEVMDVAPPEALAEGLAAALSWLSCDESHGARTRLATVPSTAARHALLSSAIAHGRDPGAALDAALLADDPSLRALALGAIGRLGRRDRRAALAAGMQADEASSRYAAAWSATLLGDPIGPVVLRELASGESEHAETAAGLAALALPRDDATAWIEQLAARGWYRVAARAAAALGDPIALDRLLAWLDEPVLARLAGDAVTTITGIAVAGDVAAQAPEGFEAGPSDAPDDEDVRPDPDADLAWPCADALRDACRRRMLPAGTRHLLGQPLSRAVMSRALAAGRQPDRARAAFELARLGEPWFDVAAPARRQHRALAARIASGD